MKLIYANIMWFLILIFGIMNATLERFSSEDWNSLDDVRLKFTLLYSLVSLLLGGSILGLLLKRKWGYELALASNASMVFLPISLFIVTLILAPTMSTSDLISSHSLNLVVSSISLVFWVAQMHAGIKSKYAR